MRNIYRTNLRLAYGGFTLIELMVGLVLGMVTVLLISQVLAVSEGKSRTVASGSSAQVNGALAMFTLQRDIQHAGYGAISSPDATGCSVKAKYGASGAQITFPLVPVAIDNGADGAADAITILQANTTGSSAPIPVTSNHAASDSSFFVESSLGVQAGDLMIVVPPSLLWETDSANWWCTMFSATDDSTTPLSKTRIPQAAGNWNQSSIMPAGQYVGSSLATQPRSYLLNMGNMVLRTYSINAGSNLQMTERSTADGSVGAGQELFSNVVNLQALYGKDTDGDGVVDAFNDTTPTTNAEWQQVVAVRIAIVARSTQFEKEEVTQSAPAWDVGTAATVSGPTTYDCNGSKCIALTVIGDADWKHYRYKVYDTIVPLRNVLWNS
ncbi:PilW family protein [Variovorax dokdonensis]|uniref:PilW family protein n=1 Tax=Variovorax dokdonensis TaxID=344883 RepID=A0ABT7N9M7_9BURK|nr:PilW family protein [Variovorax dokdonensis]MDM0044631.1 PilW family protein [Variovorax dokdonensis]